MKTTPFLVHALSPLHAGIGSAEEVIDLPIARMKATGIPFVPGSSIKGVLRDLRRSRSNGNSTEAVFGPSADPAALAGAAAHAGALVVGDARLLLLPVRSFLGTFAWVTSPLLLFLANRDFNSVLPVPKPNGRGALIGESNACLRGDCIYLEDLDLPAKADVGVDSWAAVLAPRVSPGEDIFTKRLVVVDDDTMTFLCETATQVDSRVRLDEETRTVARGALWLEESLPPETVLLGLLGADRSRKNGVNMGPEEILRFALPAEEVIQLGGHATTGRGRCRIVPCSLEPTSHG